MDAKDFPVDIDDDDDVSTNRYAFLVAKTNDSDVIIDKGAKVLVSFLDGVVLLQTDKPIYTPRQSGSLEYTKGIVSLRKKRTGEIICANKSWQFLMSSLSFFPPTLSQIESR